MRFELGLVAVLFLDACGGRVTFVDPPPPPPPTGPTILQLSPATEDAAAAQALGWGSAIPDAEVTLTPTDSSTAPQTFRSSATGVVDLDS